MCFQVHNISMYAGQMRTLADGPPTGSMRIQAEIFGDYSAEAVLVQAVEVEPSLLDLYASLLDLNPSLIELPVKVRTISTTRRHEKNAKKNQC